MYKCSSISTITSNLRDTHARMHHDIDIDINQVIDHFPIYIHVGDIYIRQLQFQNVINSIHVLHEMNLFLIWLLKLSFYESNLEALYITLLTARTFLLS